MSEPIYSEYYNEDVDWEDTECENGVLNRPGEDAVDMQEDTVEVNEPLNYDARMNHSLPGE